METAAENTTVEKPLCPVFGLCGGCAHQHLSYEEELAVKSRLLRERLTRSLPIPESFFEPVTPSPESYHTRSRIDLSLMRTRQHGPLVGYMPAVGRKIVPVDSCPIARREISDFIPELKQKAIEMLPPDYRTANLVVKTGDDGRILWGGIGRRSLRLEPRDYLWTEIHGVRIHYSLETFFQANLAILPALISALREAVQGEADSLFFDLYAGVGLFGLCLADSFRRVVLIEECAPSVELARYNAARLGFDHVSVVEGRVEDKLPAELEAAGSGRSIAMIDPPRRGLSETAALTLIEARGLDRLFYLSCHPDSLARDLEKLAPAWSVEKVMPFDFFPRTVHLETLVFLRREDRA